jgi:transposase-like protein
MSMTGKIEHVEVITSVQRRRRCSAEEKAAIVRETCAPGMSVSLFAFPPAIRKVIYTTNAVESLHCSPRKFIKTLGSFPTDEAALKLLFPVIRNAGVKWRRPVEWTTAMGQFAILFGDRFEPSAC